MPSGSAHGANNKNGTKPIQPAKATTRTGPMATKPMKKNGRADAGLMQEIERGSQSLSALDGPTIHIPQAGGRAVKRTNGIPLGLPSTLGAATLTERTTNPKLRNHELQAVTVSLRKTASFAQLTDPTTVRRKPVLDANSGYRKQPQLCAPANAFPARGVTNIRCIFTV